MGKFGGGCGNSEAEERLFSYFHSFPGGWCRQEILRREAQPLPGVTQGLEEQEELQYKADSGKCLHEAEKEPGVPRRKGSLPTSAARKAPWRRP